MNMGLENSIEKDIETLNEIIETGWLISDYDKCTAISACEDAIKALKQYSVLDKIRAEINGLPSYMAKYIGGVFALHIDKEKVLEIIDKYKAESEIYCNCTDAEIAKSFIEDVEAVKDLLPQESEG